MSLYSKTALVLSRLGDASADIEPASWTPINNLHLTLETARSQYQVRITSEGFVSPGEPMLVNTFLSHRLAHFPDASSKLEKLGEHCGVLRGPLRNRSVAAKAAQGMTLP